MKILVINAGSSSIKYQLIDMDDESVIAKGQAERIGIEGSNVKQSSAKGEIVFNAPLKNHAEAMEYIVKALTDKEKGVISDMKQIDAVGHRVLHGGASFTESQVVNPRAAAQPRQHPGHRGLPEDDARHPQRRGVRHGLPPDHAALRLHVRRAL